jgi:hypothetical protein
MIENNLLIACIALLREKQKHKNSQPQDNRLINLIIIRQVKGTTSNSVSRPIVRRSKPINQGIKSNH